MSVQITGGTATQRAAVLRAYDHVLAILPSPIAVPVRIVWWPFGLPRGTEARSTPQGVQILAASMEGPLGRPEYLLYEEIAHHIAADQGLPNDGNAGMFLQELFAGYVKFTLTRQHQPQLMSRLTLPEISTTGWQRFYGFGTDLGALLAGMDQVEPVIQRFITCPALAEAVRARGADTMADLRTRHWDAPSLLRRCRQLHPQLQHAWDAL